MTKNYNRTSEKPKRRRHRRAITLVEMLVAMAITLVMMAAVVTVFDQIGQGVNDSRSTLEMSARLRNTRNRLQNDLASQTCPTRPWIRPESGLGYFEYYEGPHVDAWIDLDPNDGPDPLPGTDRLPTSLVGVNGVYSEEYPSSNPASLVDFSTLGDYDDILMLTVRSHGEPFLGRFGTETIQSHVAEVIWYAVENPYPPLDPSIGEPGLRTIYRRVLLVAPWTDLSDIRDGSGNPIDPLNVEEYYKWYDVSSRVVTAEGGGGPVPVRVPNSLSDLTKRENRFAHLPGAFPHPIDVSAIHPLNVGLVSALKPFISAGVVHERLGEDVMLSNVLAFDVRAYDSAAPLYQVGDAVVVPGDSAWRPLLAAPVGFGAYVDLQYAPGVMWPPPPLPIPLFADTPLAKSGLLRTYDSWPIHYEHDGLDQDDGGGGPVDEGTDGFDNDGVNGVDDMFERETAPPYNVPLRGIEVRIRVYEPDSRQIREVMVRQSFVPE